MSYLQTATIYTFTSITNKIVAICKNL